MTARPIKNMAASVRDRLLARSRESGENFQFLLQRYAAERFLYRLGKSRHREQYVLKGAMLFALWGGPVYRPTRDLDFTGYGSSEAAGILSVMRDVCTTAVEDDGLVFNADGMSAEQIRDDAEYDGLRVKFEAALGAARIPMQIDIGFGNAIMPPAGDVEYPTLLDTPAPHIRAYPHEAVVAEKMHTMVVLGERNSRYKDFYDLHVMAHQFRFDGPKLAESVKATFERRRSTIGSALPVSFSPGFFEDAARATQWRAYLKKNALPGAPADFSVVGETIRNFLGPVWSSIAENAEFSRKWGPEGSWAVANE